MKNFLFLGNPENSRCRTLVKEAYEFLTASGAECRAGGKLSALGLLPEAEDDFPADVALVFGGDGTILNALGLLSGKEIPVLGINLGHVGYLAAAEPENTISILKDCLEGKYLTEERITLEACFEDKSLCGINEAVLYRVDKPHILNVSVGINGQEVTRIRADGIIVATPTGSTAYNLSAGGPLMVPTAENLVVTPICAHSMLSRPLVVGSKDVITLTVEGNSVLSLDGKTVTEISARQAVTLKTGTRKIRFIRSGNDSFYKTLQKKLSRQ